MRKILIAILALGMSGVVRAAGPRDEHVGRSWSGERRERYTPELQASNYYLEGVRYMTDESWQAAGYFFTRALKYDPAHAPSYYQLGQIFGMFDSYGQALPYARKACELVPENLDYAENYGRLLALNEQYDEAETVLGALIAADSSRIAAVGMLAALKSQHGDTSEALRLIDLAERRGIYSPPMVELKRQILVQGQRYRESYDYMACAAAANPDNSRLHIYLAELAATFGDDSTALAEYQTAIRIDSLSVAPRIALAEYYRIKGGNSAPLIQALFPVFASPEGLDAKTKISYFNDYVRTPENYTYLGEAVDSLAGLMLGAHPDDPAVREFYTMHLIDRGDLDRLAAFEDQRIRSGKATVSDFQTAIELAEYQESRDSSRRYMALALGQYPRNDTVALMALYMELRDDNPDGAVAIARQALRATRNDSIRSSLHGALGDIAYKADDTRTAFKEYRKALHYNPDNSLILNNYSYYLSLLGEQLPEALVMAERANELSPQNATFLDTQAWVLYKMRRYDEAQALMRRVMVLDDKPGPDVLMHYGDILDALGSRFMAETYWKRALEAGADAAEVEKRLQGRRP